MAVPRIFVSHSHWDNVECRRIVEYLRGALPTIPVFFDESELHGGDEWLQRIQYEVVQATIFMIVLSRHSVDAAAVWVKQEANLALSLAVEAEKIGEKRTIIPIRVDQDLAMSAILQFAPLLTLRQIVDILPGTPDSRLHDLVQVVSGQQSDQARPGVAPAPAQAQVYVEARALARQVHVAVEQHRWALAMEVGSRAVLLPGNTEDATLWGDYAAALITLQEWDEGRNALETALKLNPKRSDLWQAKAQLLQRQGQIAEASKAYDEAFHTTAAPEVQLALLREHYEALRADPNQARRSRMLNALALDLAPNDAYWQGQQRAATLAPYQTRYDAAMQAQDFSEALAVCDAVLAPTLAPGDATWVERKAQAIAARDAALRETAAAEQRIHEANAKRLQEEAEAQRRAGEAILQRFLLPRLAQLGFQGRATNAGTAVIIPPLVTVPAGPFWMGSDKKVDKDAQSNEHRQQVMVGEFQIGVYPVTVAEYACAVQAGGVREPPERGNWGAIAWQKQLQRLDHPVVNVSWLDVQSYLAWLRQITADALWCLPNEAEWEKAARGTDGRIYPWGNTWDKRRANTNDGGPGTTTPVGQYDSFGDVSPMGCHDMAGNVWEWTSSIYFDEPYQYDDKRENSSDTSSPRVLRGGSWDYYPRDARAAYRSRLAPGSLDLRGFRVARAGRAG